MSRRKPPTMKQKLAAALLTIVRPYGTAPDGSPLYEYVVPPSEARSMTPEQIIARFHFDHGVYATWGGPNDPWNLTPRPVREHIDKTKIDAGKIAKVRRAEKKRLGLKKPSRPIPGSRNSPFKRKMSGKTELRT